MADSRAELRVHGVAGTPPESTLDLRAQLLDPTPDDCGRPPRPKTPVQVGVYGRPGFGDSDVPVEAFRWGGLTSGRPSTARWLLLVPFVLFNAAGWATVWDGTSPTLDDTGIKRGISTRVHIALVRVGGLILTGIACGIVALVVDVLMQWAFPHFQSLADPGYRRVARALGFGLVALLMAGLWYWTRLRLRPEALKKASEPASDPAGYGQLHRDQMSMWNHPGIITRLRNLHLGFALGIAGWMATVAPTYQTGDWTTVADAGWPALVPAAAIVAPALTIIIISGTSGTRGEDASISRLGRWGAPTLGWVAAAVGVFSIWRWRPGTEVGPVPALRGALIVMCGALAAVVAMTWLTQSLVRRRAPVGVRTPYRTTFTTPALMLLSLAAMVGGGASLALVLVQTLGGSKCRNDATSQDCVLVVGDHVNWVAIAYSAALVLLVVVAAIAIWRADGSGMEKVKRVVTRPARVFAWTFLVGIVISAALMVAVAATTPLITSARLATWLDTNTDRLTFYVAFAAGVMFAVAVLWFGWVKRRLWGLILALIAIAGSICAIVADRQITLLGVPLPPTSSLQAVMAIGLLLPIGAVATRVFTAMSDVEARRGIGVIWDLGMFWPRWFHPFTPPTYSDRAVTDLTDRIATPYVPGVRASAAEAPSPGSKCLVVSAHSQGAILAAAALLLHSQQHPETPLKHVGLLTYGNPWGRLYGELFPSVFTSAALTALTDVLDGPSRGDERNIRWRNLQRMTDPIGGPIVTADQPWLMADPTDLSEEIERDTITGNPTATASIDPCGRIHSGYTVEPGYPVVLEQLDNLACKAPWRDQPTDRREVDKASD